MKYMGSKRAMLQNGLGRLIREESTRHDRIVDLFSGSGSVSWFAAQHFEKPVLSVDLQEYAKAMAKAVVERTVAVEPEYVADEWLGSVTRRCYKRRLWKAAQALESPRTNTATWVARARVLCSEENGGVLWNSYGGYYFSPSQSLLFDVMLDSLPARGPTRWVCLAATIVAASRCAASPGHTAQPFQPTRTASEYLRDAWSRDPLAYARRSLREIAPLCAKVRGQAKRGNAIKIVNQLDEADLMFVDPPYSAVHYSRFYHVLETIARGWCSTVSGSGRYPPVAERPISDFSLKSEAATALRALLSRLSEQGCTVILTFPAGQCSNGLSGKCVCEIANSSFSVDFRRVKTRFSTLGGNNQNRSARTNSRELILLLRPLR